MRDSQRERMYESERLLRRVLRNGGEIEMFGHKMHMPMERKFASLDSVQAYVDYVLGHASVIETFGDVTPVRVRARRSSLKAHMEAGGIMAIPPHKEGGNSSWAMTETVILHELAHHLHGWGCGAAHGPEYCGVYVKLVELVMSPEAAWMLQVYMDGQGCKVLPYGHVQRDETRVL